jgi:hypothetical protein
VSEPRSDLSSFLGLLFESMAAAGDDPIKVWGWLYDYLVEAGWDEEAERLLNTPWPLGPESHSPAAITRPKGKRAIPNRSVAHRPNVSQKKSPAHKGHAGQSLPSTDH